MSGEKIRTLSQFEEAVDRETSWRKRELTSIKLAVDSSRASKVQLPLRSGITLLYAHWEGWIKSISTMYVEFVAIKGLKYSQLSESFLGIALRTNVNQLNESKTSLLHNRFASFVISDGLDSKAPLSADVIRTESNLSSSVLKDIVSRVGIRYDPYELNENLIDKKLVHSRNTIAHGNHLNADLDSFNLLYNKIRDLLDTFTTDILVAARTESYRR